MSKRDPLAIARVGEPSPAVPEQRKPEEPVIAASHEVLFASPAVPRCDACGKALAEAEEPGPYGASGQGVYLWTRGDGVHFESAPLCSSCASAIGMTALARWEIEEEEG
jgi:hypothetical protein